MSEYPRTVGALLREKRRAWADLSTGVYLGPFGLDAHRVEVNGVEVKIPSAAGAVTFEVGDAVLVGSLAGNSKRSIVGRPPSGFGGQSAFTPERLDTSASALALELVDPGTIKPEAEDFAVVLLGRGLDGALTAEAVLFDDDTDTIVIDDRVEIALGDATDPVPTGLPDGQEARDATVTLGPAVEVGETIAVRLSDAERSTILPAALEVVASGGPVFARILTDTGTELVLYGVTVNGDLIEQERRTASYDALQCLSGTTVVAVDGTASGAGPIPATALQTIDMATGTTATHSPAAGKFIGAPAVAASRVWWSEWDTVETGTAVNVKVYSAPFDLASPTLEHDTSHTWGFGATWGAYMDAWHIGADYAAASAASGLPSLSHWDLNTPANDTTFVAGAFEVGQGSPRPNGAGSLRTVFRSGDSTWRAKSWLGSGTPATDSTEGSFPASAAFGSEMLARDLYAEATRVLRVWEVAGDWFVGEVTTAGAATMQADIPIDSGFDGSIMLVTGP